MCLKRVLKVIYGCKGQKLEPIWLNSQYLNRRYLSEAKMPYSFWIKFGNFGYSDTEWNTNTSIDTPTYILTYWKM